MQTRARLLAVVVLFLLTSPGQHRPGAAQGATVPSGATIVVAQDGSGAFRTIQEALDSIPADNASWRTILIKNGTYQEKVFINAGHVALVGEDRDRTRIVFAELRKNWRVTHPDDWGSAVVNIADTATDIFIGNLTVLNNYGALHGDHDHQFAVRSGGAATRIWIVHARVAADGGDTLSLWNTGNGMYYHADCDFEGWVDYVCPRGWCYITNSRFVGHSLTASIWHDGSKDPDQKLVVRRSKFDGDKGFALGRNNRDGQFFLLDNWFSAAMADKAIYWPSAPETYQWPPRVYYWGNTRDGADFPWYRDNLREAAGAPVPRAITASWTFAGKWDPEGTMPAVLPFASTPRPEDGDRDVDVRLGVLTWVGARGASSYRVSFGTVNPPPMKAVVQTPGYAPGTLTAGTTYFWRVDAVTTQGTVTGPVWSFAVPGVPREGVAPGITWKDCLNQPAAWYASAEAVRIAGNLILYQRASGGWPKNIDMARSLTPTEVATVTDEKDLNDSTIDNESTYAQLRYLALVFGATRRPDVRAAFDRGVAYLLKAQYPNGGWPQYYPLRANYSRHITFNDNAMVGVLRLLRDVSAGREPYGFVDEAVRQKAAAAVARGIALILKAQVRVGGALTAWCAQHDEVTLAPAPARAYEHASLSGSESVGIVRFLMDIEQPSGAVVAAIEGAVAWFGRSALRGVRVDESVVPDAPHGRERVVVVDAAAPPIWARFYEIATNRPIFSDRDGVIKYSLAEIGIERRTGYSWYGTWPLELLEREYPRWKKNRGGGR